MKLRKCNSCGLEKPITRDNFYYSPSRFRWEKQCKQCTLTKQNYRRRLNYDPKKERERYLKLKENGYFKTAWQVWRDKYPEKYKARNTLRNAVAGGKVKKEKCQICDEKVVQAHHEDYSKPLEVTWLCMLHHKERHHGKFNPVRPNLKYRKENNITLSEAEEGKE